MIMPASFPSPDRPLGFIANAAEQRDWSAVVDLALQHRVHPHVWHAYKHDIPDPHKTVLREHVARNARAVLRNLARTVEAVQMLGADGIDCIVLKGPLLAEMLYADRTMRISTDVDILVHPRDVARAARLFEEAGYAHHSDLDARSLAQHLQHEHDITFAHPADQSIVELHVDVAQPHYSYRVDLSTWWRHARTIDVAGTQLRILAVEHAYLLALLHAAKHHWHRLDMIVDLAAFQCMISDHGSVRQEATGAGMLKVLQVSEALIEWLRDPSAVSGSPLAAELIAKVRAASEFGRWEGIWIDLKVRERTRDRARYLVGLAARGSRKALH